MYKSSGFREQWGRRWFQLRGNILFHYVDKNSEIAKNMTFLEDIRVVPIEHRDRTLKYGFAIKYSNESNFFFFLYIFCRIEGYTFQC
jgi:hypothetical protein